MALIDKNTILKVRNRDNGTVGYRVPDLGVVRCFEKGETKEITMEELRKLSYLPGGDYIIRNCLLIDNADAVAELIGDVEPEYYYTEAEIKELLVGRGTLAQLEDCLNFAPRGVLDLVKNIAVKSEINNISKRELIQKKLGFNVSKAIEINRETAEEAPQETKGARNAAPITSSATPVRKAAAIKKD